MGGGQLALAMREDLSRVMKSNMMMGAVTFLLFVIYLLPGFHQLKLQGPELTKGSDQQVKLECTGEPGESMDNGIYWIRQTNANPENIMYLSVTSKPIYNFPKYHTRFKADKSGLGYSLNIKSFAEQDQGTYYCMISQKSLLIFSPGHRLFYPEATTPKSTTITKPPTPATSGSQTPYDCGSSCDKKEANVLGIDCDTHVWLPLAALCGFLLLCLAITSILLCCREYQKPSWPGYEKKKMPV